MKALQSIHRMLVKRSIPYLSLLLVLFVNAQDVRATDLPQEEVNVRSDEKSDIPYIGVQTEQKIDEVHESASILLVNTAQWLDSFFDDPNYIDEENKTRATLKLTAGYDRHEGFDFKPRLSLRLKVPRTEGRLNLIISFSDDEDFDLDNNPLSSSSTDHIESDRDELTAGLRWLISQSKRSNLSTTAGGSYDYVYVGLRYRGYYDYGSWQGRFVERIRYYTDDGFENKIQYDLERQVSDRFFFRTKLDVKWSEEESGLPHGLIFYLDQVFGPEKAIRYEWGNYFDTSPSYAMSDLQLRLRYRQRFYRDWLVLEIGPMVSFPRDYDREINPGIVVRLEADFGYKAYLKDFKNIFHF